MKGNIRQGKNCVNRAGADAVGAKSKFIEIVLFYDLLNHLEIRRLWSVDLRVGVW